ncbi:hypothetical protein MMEU_4474 [Mycobacterium marinum str. Europe]|nr:hypothetical protein MMEU_4474 [Mycobacterium marinum str. Europe]
MNLDDPAWSRWFLPRPSLPGRDIDDLLTSGCAVHAFVFGDRC